MSKQRLKLLLWIALSLIALGSLSFLITGLGNVLAYFQRGANPGSALKIAPNVPPDLFLRLEWMPDKPDAEWVLDPYTRQQIETTYMWAWVQWNISHLRKTPYGLGTYFTGPALRAVSQGVTAAAEQGLQVNQVNTAHRLRVNLLSADGNLIALTDEEAEVSSIIRDASGKVVFSGETRAVYDMVLLQQEGRWQIRDFVRRDATVVDDLTNMLTWEDSPAFQPDAETETPYLAGINYYPQATPWDNFWTDYDEAVVEQDFGLIASLGLNTIRVFIGFDVFGGPVVKPEMLDKLDNLLTHADAHGLKVIVTLFDFRTNYDPLLWPQADRHLEGLIPRFADRDTILAWDIKNEPDLDYKANNETVVNAWLAHSARLIHTLAPQQKLTIGWASAQAASKLQNFVSFVSFHDYLPPSGLGERLERLQAFAGDKPIVLGEFGLPTWNSVFPNGHTEAEQAEYYSDVLNIVRSEKLAGWLAWTLYDFSAVPTSVAGRLPWQSGPQANLGVVRRDGSLKPAAALLAADADLNVPRVPPYARFLKPFWLIVIGGAGGGVIMIVFIFVRRRRRRKRKG